MLNFHQYNIQAAIFDMDGTMFDTERLRIKTLQQASKELMGTAFSESYLMGCLGLSAKSAEQLAKAQYGDLPYQKIRQKADELELQYVREHGVPVKKGVVQVLERLRQSGLRLAVATSSRRAIAEEYLINANVFKYFDVLVCGDEVVHGKPHPEIFMTAAEKINTTTDRCLMFEDSANGLQSAVDAGGVTVLLQDLKAPTEKMLCDTHFFYESIELFLEDLNVCVEHKSVPQPKAPFPQSLNQLSVGIHGFGAIGGGYLAQIFSHWDGYTRPHKIYASTRNPLYRSAVNAFGSYCIRYGEIAFDERIENIHMLDANDAAQMSEMYQNASVIAICIPEQAYKQDIDCIALGLLNRYQHHPNEPLTLLLVINKMKAKQYFQQLLLTALADLCDEHIQRQIMQQLYICETVVNRMVSRLTDAQIYRQLRIKYAMFKQAQQDETESFCLEEATDLAPEQEQNMQHWIDDLQTQLQPSHVLQQMDLILFHAETDMPIYIEEHSPHLTMLSQVILVDDIYEVQLIKNRLWNGVHAILAWSALHKRHDTIGVAMSDPELQALTEQLTQEVVAGLSLHLPKRRSDLDRLTSSFLSSCSNAFKDPCARVARDPLRKLAAQERVLGSIAFNMQYEQPYAYLLQGVALGLQYALDTEELTVAEAKQYIRKQFAQIDTSIEIQQEALMQVFQHLDVLRRQTSRQVAYGV